MCNGILRRYEDMPRAVVVCAAHGLTALLLVGGHAAHAAAEPILVSDERFLQTFTIVESSGEDTRRTSEVRPAVPFGPFDVTISSEAMAGGSTSRVTAFQRTVVTPTRFTGTGRTDAIAHASGSSFAAASNVFAITFDLLVPHRYEFSGTFDRAGNGGFTEFEVAFAGEGALGPGQTWGPRGILPAGRHEFYIDAFTELRQSTAYERAGYDVDLFLQPTPEPTSSVLLVTGFAGAAGWRGWRRRRRRSACR